METTTVEPLHLESSLLELPPQSRICRLREMYWNGTHESKRVRKPIAGSGVDTLVGHAEDFASLLRASDPVIQPDELIVGCALAVPEDKDSIDLGYYNGHYPPGHENVLRKGFAGMRDEAHTRLQTETAPEKRDFYRAVEISHDAACGYAAAYADCARQAAGSESDPIRQTELFGIAEVCDELAVAPPSSFQAALQLVQFTRLFGASGCIGRFDQWMIPFLEADLERERLSFDEAQELLECLFIKLNYFAPAGGQPNDSLRNIALAGQTPDGRDASNRLSYMCLEASGKLMLPEPKLNVRFFDDSPPELLRACCRVLAKGANILALFNDEVVLPALSRLGIPIEDARDYCNDGCSEIILGGRGTIQFRVNDSLPLLTKTVKEARNRTFETFDQVMDDFKSRLVGYMPEDRGENPPVTFPYFAAGIDDCMERGSPSGVRYPITGSILAQVGDTADGLAAIQELIYEEGALTWDDLVSAVESNFEGHEPLRQMLRNRGPKYGNDDDRVDHIVKEITEAFCDGVHERAGNLPGHGNKRAPGLMCFGIQRKADLPASPDGRRKGDLTANSFSPAVGMDRSGPTAVLKSVEKVDLTKASHGSVLDLALHSSFVAGEEAFGKFVALLESFLTMRCTATLQLNIIDRDTLLRARENPTSPEFRTLIVRVWGFSAVFVELPEDLQNHVLSRTEHGMA